MNSEEEKEELLEMGRKVWRAYEGLPETSEEYWKLLDERDALIKASVERFKASYSIKPTTWDMLRSPAARRRHNRRYRD